MISVHSSSDSTPITTSGEGAAPVMSSTVLSVYSGLVPMSPNTTPSAERPSCRDRGRFCRILGLDFSLGGHAKLRLS